MKILRDILDKIEPSFKKGSKFEKFHPLYDMVDTFLFTPSYKADTAPFIRDGIDLKRTMILVVLSLLPCFFFGIYNVGSQHFAFFGSHQATFIEKILIGMESVLPIYLVVFTVGGICEAIFAVVRKHEINEGFLVTGFLIPLLMPPSIPLWMVAVSTVFGIVIGKEIFGGTGYNIFNPALVARAFTFFAYPSYMSGDSVWVYGMPGNSDGISSATSLLTSSTTSASISQLNDSGLFGFLSGSLHNNLMETDNYLGMLGKTDLQWSSLFIGNVPGSIGETSTLCVIFGAFFLLLTGIASWRVMLGVLIGMISTSFFLYFFGVSINSLNPMMYIPPHYHFVMGSFAFGTVFMATDPVSSAQTDKGRLYYGLLIGFMCIVIRCINPAYPEGMMLAILFSNALSPLIDYKVVSANIKKRLARYER